MDALCYRISNGRSHVLGRSFMVCAYPKHLIPLSPLQKPSPIINDLHHFPKRVKKPHGKQLDPLNFLSLGLFVFLTDLPHIEICEV